MASERAESDFFLSTYQRGYPLCVTRVAPFDAAEDMRRELPRVELVIGLQPRGICSRSRRCNLMHVFQLSRALHVNPRHGHGMRTRTVCYYAKGWVEAKHPEHLTADSRIG